jgi:hypothetical protein
MELEPFVSIRRRAQVLCDDHSEAVGQVARLSDLRRELREHIVRLADLLVR